VERIELLYPAPIPLGHRVEVTWYRRPELDFWGTESPSSGRKVPGEPALRDLDTGVLYGPDWIFAERIAPPSSIAPRPMALEAREGLVVAEQVTGRVRYCRVAYQHGEWPLQTTLLVEPEIERSAYR
jgi:hypothetical protein